MRATIAAVFLAGSLVLTLPAEAASHRLTWALYNPNGSQNCYATFTFSSPGSTWICRLYNAGTYQVRTGTASRSGYIRTSIS